MDKVEDTTGRINNITKTLEINNITVTIGVKDRIGHLDIKILLFTNKRLKFTSGHLDLSKAFDQVRGLLIINKFSTRVFAHTHLRPLAAACTV